MHVTVDVFTVWFHRFKMSPPADSGVVFSSYVTHPVYMGTLPRFDQSPIKEKA